MPDKITLAPNQIVSRKNGWVQYIDGNGTQRKARTSIIQVVGDEQPPAQEPPQMSPTLEQAVDKEPSPDEERIVASKSQQKRKTAQRGNGAVRSIGGKAFDLSRYKKTKAPGGGVSYHNDDEVATLLDGKDLDQVYKVVASKTKTEESELRKKYKHLNPGMQRMNLGNRLRKVLIPKTAR